ncbi:Di-copper centre-containing protein [Byssothecium circinans]|uniref:tyrosinase n=1 Tax=Byssothecium circinans TaxID=147558 RepID=A0A6A5TIJ7_9PLEO|nr:Di-copper centre-containing protein [Byssothecium circinans]
MKSFFTAFGGFTTSLSLLTLAQAAAPYGNGTLTNSTSSAGSGSCGIPGRTDENSYFSVVGVQGTGVQVRQELRELEKDTETWNLFLQAFARFQDMDQNDKVSYFKVAGMLEWDGVKGEGLKGYCPHNSNLFGSWHRPYLALFEQVLHDRARDIANEYPAGAAREKALKVADKIRLPYWDWAMDPPNKDEGVMPKCLRQPRVTITYPNGTKGEIRNPLYEYDFHPLRYDDFSALSEFQFKNWNTSIRAPLDGYAENATSRNDEANSRVGSQQPNNRDTLYKLLTIHQPWNQWSTKANGGNIGSVETIHDGVHNSFGLGHMGIVEVSSFDPVFWFHHCNMDRIMAIYQSRYPDTWVEDAKQAAGTFTMAEGSIQGPDSVLTPFHMNAKGDMWTSSVSRNWTSFGYTYPELVSNPSNDTLTLTINKLYKPQTQGLNNNNTITTLGIGKENKTADATDWLAEVNMPSDIQISYSVRAFLGTPDADPKKWPTDPNYVGQIASLSSPRMDSNTIITGSITLTDKLAAKYKSGELKSLETTEVTNWLKTNFHWRIQALDYTEIPRAHPPKGLNVTVFSVPVHLPHNATDVPQWTGPFNYQPEIEGNPPAYNPNSPSNTTTTGPAYNGTTGGFNETSGTWVWNETDAKEEKKSRSSAAAKSSATPISLNGGKSSSATTTGTGGAAPSSSSGVGSPSKAPSAASGTVTQPPSSASVTPGAGQSVVVETLSNGDVVTRVVTLVVTVEVPAPTDA